jgi:hypothetical protein
VTRTATVAAATDTWLSSNSYRAAGLANSSNGGRPALKSAAGLCHILASE